MRRTTSWRLLALGTTMVLGAAACGRSDTTSEGDTEGTTNGSSTETSTGGEAGGAFINPDEDCDAYEGTKGIEGDTIKVGTVRPAQGPYVIYDTITVGLESYFKFVNEKGGVKGGDGRATRSNWSKKTTNTIQVRRRTPSRSWSNKRACSPWSVRWAPRPTSPCATT